MLKDAALSLFLGILTVVLGLLCWPLLDGGPGGPGDRSWRLADTIVEVGEAVTSAAPDSVGLGSRGRAILSLPLTPFNAQDYAFLEVIPGELPATGDITLLWRSASDPGRVGAGPLPPLGQGPLRLSNLYDRGWQGEIIELGLAIQGQPGQRAGLAAIELQTMTASRMLVSLYRDWSHFVPWQQYSVNSHRGTGPSQPAIAHPLPMAALVLLASVLVYVLLYLRRGGPPFDWRVLGILALACWIILDIFWQARLLRQLAHTYETFTASDTAGQHLLGTDAALVSFINELKPRLSPPGRVFVSSASDYGGMRGAYFLYPHNVYWKRRGAELPKAQHLRAGDYISVIYPSETRYDPEAGTLVSAEHNYRVEVLLSRPAGSLYRVL